jgi:predicted branched-subunit amino acid permease
MTDFIAAILKSKTIWVFESAAGHFGGMSILNAQKKGLKLNTAIIIGSGNIVQDY